MKLLNIVIGTAAYGYVHYDPSSAFEAYKYLKYNGYPQISFKNDYSIQIQDETDSRSV